MTILCPFIFKSGKRFFISPFWLPGQQDIDIGWKLVATLKGDHPKIISVKFGEILSCGLGDGV